ncbi:unnamed protein product, partial [Amoebophrya sp. A120]
NIVHVHRGTTNVDIIVEEPHWGPKYETSLRSSGSARLTPPSEICCRVSVLSVWPGLLVLQSESPYCRSRRIRNRGLAALAASSTRTISSVALAVFCGVSPPEVRTARVNGAHQLKI